MNLPSEIPPERQDWECFAEPLLMSVKPTDDVYGEARRMQDFLSLVVGAPAEHVPSASLLREFIGGSVYEDDA